MPEQRDEEGNKSLCKSPRHEMRVAVSGTLALIPLIFKMRAHRQACCHDSSSLVVKTDMQRVGYDALQKNSEDEGNTELED
ncbi:hypothetical protein H920_15605 [Fukomys damarensis]|uniref:Uncharacterized protein n=1 Tax=Fukomys damarensis TaxID=885580 RepID=A0A091CYM6_FUKDA|nr:hypothetical protein H920_15605 [Fukomys damarensis]